MNQDDERALRVAIEALERLRSFALERGRPVLASLIELARAEAEDELRTELTISNRFVEFKEGAIAAGLETELQDEIARLKRARAG